MESDATPLRSFEDLSVGKNLNQDGIPFPKRNSLILLLNMTINIFT